MPRSSDPRAYPEWLWRVLGQVRERGVFTFPAGGRAEAFAFRAQWYAFAASVRRAPETRAWRGMPQEWKEKVEEWQETAMQAGCYFDSDTWDVTVKLKSLARGSVAVVAALEAAEAGRPLRSAESVQAERELDRRAEEAEARVRARLAQAGGPGVSVPASPPLGPPAGISVGDWSFRPRAQPGEGPEARAARHALCRRFGVRPLAADGAEEELDPVG